MTNFTNIEIGDPTLEGHDDAKALFDYGVIEVTDFKNKTVTTYNLCIRLGLVEKVKNYRGDHYTEVQFIYRDNDFKSQCALLDRNSENYSIRIVKQGNMQITL